MYSELNGKLIGFVVKTAQGKFKPFIGTPFDSPGDNDSIVHVQGSQPAQEALEQALAFFEPDLDKFAKVYRKPNKSGREMGHWLSVLEANERSADAPQL